MIRNLFSIFDPTTEISNLPLNWTRTAIGLLLIPTRIWLIHSRNRIIVRLLINKLQFISFYAHKKYGKLQPSTKHRWRAKSYGFNNAVMWRIISPTDVRSSQSTANKCCFTVPLCRAWKVENVCGSRHMSVAKQTATFVRQNVSISCPTDASKVHQFLKLHDVVDCGSLWDSLNLLEQKPERWWSSLSSVICKIYKYDTKDMGLFINLCQKEWPQDATIVLLLIKYPTYSRLRSFRGF